MESEQWVQLTTPMKLVLIHSEISEAMEGFRKGIKDEHLPDRSMFEVELADALIRIFDLAGAHDLDLGGALQEKSTTTRPEQTTRWKPGQPKVGRSFDHHSLSGRITPVASEVSESIPVRVRRTRAGLLVDQSRHDGPPR